MAKFGRHDPRNKKRKKDKSIYHHGSWTPPKGRKAQPDMSNFTVRGLDLKNLTRDDEGDEK